MSIQAGPHKQVYSNRKCVVWQGKVLDAEDEIHIGHVATVVVYYYANGNIIGDLAIRHYKLIIDANKPNAPQGV